MREWKAHTILNMAKLTVALSIKKAIFVKGKQFRKVPLALFFSNYMNSVITKLQNQSFLSKQTSRSKQISVHYDIKCGVQRRVIPYKSAVSSDWKETPYQKSSTITQTSIQLCQILFSGLWPLNNLLVRLWIRLPGSFEYCTTCKNTGLFHLYWGKK